MNSLKSSFISASLALLLNTSLYATDEIYNLESMDLKTALEQIAKEADLSFLADGKLLKDKKSPPLKDIEGVQNALKAVLKGSGLDAIIEDNTIIIKEKSENTSSLGEVDVVAGNDADGSAEDGYLIKDISGLGIWKGRSLQDTPYQMTVISSDLLENSLVNDFNDIFKKTPNIQENVYWGTPTLRGFAIEYPILEGIKTYNSLAIDPVETQRVEILNGASGFMYGSGNVGGAINYTLKKSTNEPIKNVTLGNYGGSDYYTHIDVGGKVNDSKFGYRINALYEDGETSLHNQSQNHKFISATFDYDISDEANVIVNLMHRKKEENEKAYFAFSGVDRPSAYDSSKLYKPDKPNKLEADRILGKLNWNINDIFSTRIAYHYTKEEREFFRSYNYLQTDTTFTNYTSYLAPFDFTEHGVYAYLDANFDTRNISHNFTLGVSQSYGERNEYENGSASFLTATTGLLLSDLKNIEYGNVANFGKRYTSSENKDTNILIGDDITFNEQWSALIGVNYSTVDQKSYSSNGSITSDYDKSAITPNLSLIYKPSNEFTTYISYIEALEQGTIVGDTYTNAGEILDPLISKQYEIGAKYRLNENFLISSALFRIENANQYSDDGTSTGTYVQDGLEVHQGIEITATGKITDNLIILTGFTLMDLSIEKSNDSDLEGKKPTDAASKLAKIYAEYDISSIQGLTLTGGAYYTGEKYGDTSNTDIVPSFTIYDIGARYKTKIDKYPTTFNITISNLTDEDYWASSYILGDPRNIALSMKMEF